MPQGREGTSQHAKCCASYARPGEGEREGGGISRAAPGGLQKPKSCVSPDAQAKGGGEGGGEGRGKGQRGMGARDQRSKGAADAL
eukprot:83652-Chlamydomonas_euryale.AAC.2